MPGDKLPAPIAAIRDWYGDGRCGEPFPISQQRIDAFAAATDDYNWIHVDLQRAAREAPGGRTIAHGFLLLSLSVADDVQALAGIPGIGQLINYGLDKVRFLTPVPSGARVRVRSQLLSAVEKAPGAWLLAQRKQLELDEGGTLAMMAEQLTLIVLSPQD